MDKAQKPCESQCDAPSRTLSILTANCVCLLWDRLLSVPCQFKGTTLISYSWRQQALLCLGSVTCLHKCMYYSLLWPVDAPLAGRDREHVYLSLTGSRFPDCSVLLYSLVTDAWYNDLTSLVMWFHINDVSIYMCQQHSPSPGGGGEAHFNMDRKSDS
jgi:hypothetical protein